MAYAKETPANGMPELTDANMTIFNDNPAPITVTVDNNQHMSDEFPSPSTIASGSSAAATVTASAWPSQSSFDVHFANGDTASIDLGTGIYSTSSTPESFADGQSAVLLAPGPPMTTDVDYRFWFFNGPGTLPPLINSVLQANIPAFIAYVNANPVTIPITGSLSLNLTNIAADPSTFQCTYASTIPSQSDPTKWILNALVNIGQATIQGNVAIEGQTGSMDLSLSDATIWVQAIVDPTFQIKPQVVQLQTSLGDYGGSGTIVGILEVLFPFIAALISAGATPYRVAGAINNQLNATIITAINNAIAGLFPSSAPSATEHAARSTPSEQLKVSRTLATDAGAWMSQSTIQALTLGQLKLPGTHDSGTYNLSPVLSQIQYPDIAFLWALNPGAAPANGQSPVSFPPTTTNPLYLGQTMYNWVLGVAVNSISRTQDVNIAGQLQLGIRHFDFRVYYDSTDNDFHLQHALQGPKFSDVLTQVATFIQNNNSGELIFAYISHTNFQQYPDAIASFTSLINSTLPPGSIYYQSVPSGQTKFDFQTLASSTLGSITNGTSKIMFINGDLPDVVYPDTVTNTDGYAGVPWAGELYDVASLVNQQGPPTQAPHAPLWAVSWTLGASIPTIVLTILENLTGVPVWALQAVASNANAAFGNFVTQYGPNFNLVTGDWLEYGASPSVIDAVIQMNSAGGFESNSA